MDPVETPAGERRLLARRYRLGRAVGHGGMGTVWEAHDEVLGRDVAVKEVILPHGLSDDERAIQYKRTFREARTAARLGHPGVVTVYDVVEQDGRPWIIMELIRSRSLDEVIKQEGLLPPVRAAEIARQMLAALHAAHEAGVLHRDVKPSNVLVGSGDRTVLTDFGIATATGDVTLTQTGLVMGSPAYIAPERARGRTVGPASDLWSLGITLCVMVDGKSPYERSEPMASLVAIISEEPEPPVNAGPLAPVIEGLLRKDPDERMDAHEAGMLLDDIVRAASRPVQKTRPIRLPRREPSAPAAEDLPVPPASPSRQPPPDTSPASTPDSRAGSSAAGDASGTEDTEGAVRESPAATSSLGGVPALADTGAVHSSGGADPTIAARDAARPHGPRRRVPAVRVTTTTVILAIVGVALLVLGIVAVKAANRDQSASPRSGMSKAPSAHRSRSSTASAPGQGSSSGGAPATPSGYKTPRSGAPQGFKIHKDSTGFSIALPSDWKGPETRASSRSSLFFTSPDRATFIQVDQTRTPHASALEDWRQMAKNGSTLFSGYHEIKVAPVTEGGPITDASGKKAADWEFTHGSTPTHVLNRGLVMHGRGYAILLSAPDSGWKDTLNRLAPVFELFQPA
jgi:serine/threonine protein kinase